MLIWSYHSSWYLPDMIPNIIHLSIFQTTSPGTLEQTLFILLASLAGVAFLVVLGLLLCKFQVKIINSIIFIKSSNIYLNINRYIATIIIRIIIVMFRGYKDCLQWGYTSLSWEKEITSNHVQVGPGGLSGVVTVTSGTSPLSARWRLSLSSPSTS